jgi:serine/threonine-protein kinase
MQPGNSLGGGRYRVERQLGQGGMGAVFQALDTVLDRRVAIKVLASLEPEGQERFAREARVVARLHHPHIGSIFDIAQEGGRVFIVQELLEGEPLGTRLRQAPLPLGLALTLLAQVADALQFAHGAGVVHRDVKPANIFVTADGTAKLIDFGIATLAGGTEITRPGTMIGTPAYSAPEQIRGEPVDLQADVFAFGVVAFEVIAGRRPFGGQDLVSTMHAILSGPVPSLGEAVPGCPPALAELVDRCLERAREQRLASMTDVADQLLAIRAGLDDEAAARIPHATSNRPRPPAGVAAAAAHAVEDALTGTRVGPVLMPEWAGETTIVVGGLESVLANGTRVGKFTVHELVARGQTGHLYKAYDPVRARLVGLKVIREPAGPVVERLLRASRIWLELRHPHLQTILEVDPGEQSRMALVATELIQGVDLERLTRQRDLDVVDKIGLGIQLCDALEYMHARGIVHREVTPRNLVVSEAPLRLTLLDSGLARSADLSMTADVTRTGIVVGHFRYMAPEQASGRYDQRSDIYAAGAVLYELLTGTTFPGSGPEHASTREASAAALPKPLADALLTALQSDPDRRFSTVSELADALRSLVPDTRAPVKLSEIVVTLHGIRTHAKWQRTFTEVAARAGLQCRLDRWNFGYFSILKFMAPWSRAAKVDWFRNTYHDEFGEQAMSALSSDRPSIVAHSFGTYVLGNALLRYPYLRFNKVLLCGSILPRDFPWDVLIDRGQVQAVRNEYGARDVWTRLAQWFVPGTGPSGLVGFSNTHERLEQERFDYSHSEYFERGHMEARWVPFVKRRVRHITPRDRATAPPRGTRSVGAWILYALLLAAVAAIAWRALA